LSILYSIFICNNQNKNEEGSKKRRLLFKYMKEAKKSIHFIIWLYFYVLFKLNDSTFKYLCVHAKECFVRRFSYLFKL